MGVGGRGRSQAGLFSTFQSLTCCLCIVHCIRHCQNHYCVPQAQAAVQDSGSSDSGWTMLPNGTWARKTSSWSSHTQTSSGSGELGGVGTGVVLPGGGEQGHHGSNDTGWITRPDGTMVKKTSAWASWSSSSHDGLSDSALEDVQRGLEQRVRNHLPGNVEPGYEQQWQSRARSRRSIAEFESELASCGSRCTVIKCTIGPLEKDESVLFKIRSRLFTETQVKNYAEKVKISSKLVTRVTRLPFLVPVEHLAIQSHSITTTVIPSEAEEMGIPWQVWIFAAIGGCLLLALITYCLYKVTLGFCVITGVILCLIVVWLLQETSSRGWSRVRAFEREHEWVRKLP